MIKEVKNYAREELFNYFNEFESPFIVLTTEVDVTNIVEFCREKHNFYATLGYLITMSVNQTEAFKYRYKDGKFYYCEEVRSHYTEKLKDDNLGWFGVLPTSDYPEYIKRFKSSQRKLIEDNEFISSPDPDEIWLSCTPWFSFTSLVTPMDRKVTIPQFFWDKYTCKDDKYYVHLTIMIHHGLADGYHIGVFLKHLAENIANFNG